MLRRVKMVLIVSFMVVFQRFEERCVSRHFTRFGAPRRERSNLSTPPLDSQRIPVLITQDKSSCLTECFAFCSIGAVGIGSKRDSVLYCPIRYLGLYGIDVVPLVDISDQRKRSIPTSGSSVWLRPSRFRMIPPHVSGIRGSSFLPLVGRIHVAFVLMRQ